MENPGGSTRKLGVLGIVHLDEWNTGPAGEFPGVFEKVSARHTNPLSAVSFIRTVEETGEQLDWCGQLYEAQAANLILYCRSFGLGHSEAEDLVQELFASLLQMPAAPDRPAHYAVRALRNRALNYRRSFVRRVLRELESSRWFEPSEGESRGETQAMRCLTQLPRDQREVIVLKVWHGHTFEEIGELTGCSPNTAAGRYRYGLQKMRQCLNGSDYETEEFLGTSDGVLDSPASILRT